MKKYTILIIAIVLSVSLSGCLKTNNDVDTKAKPTVEAKATKDTIKPTVTSEPTIAPLVTNMVVTPSSTLTSEVKSDRVPKDNWAGVESIDIKVDGTIQIEAKGNFSNGCGAIEKYSWERSGNKFLVDLLLKEVAPDRMCTEALVPFTQTIVIKYDKLDKEKYEVDVNGILKEFVNPLYVANVVE